MNLIEQLGGYKKALQFLKSEKNSLEIDPVFYLDGQEILVDVLDDALLEYRRQHNIFEVGDKVAWINSIAPNDPRLFEIEENLGEKPDTWSLRHATDEEIKAGKRLEVNNGSI